MATQDITRTLTQHYFIIAPALRGTATSFKPTFQRYLSACLASPLRLVPPAQDNHQEPPRRQAATQTHITGPCYLSR